MQPSVAVTAPPVILQSGTTGTSTMYANNTSAKVSVRARSNWLSGWAKRVRLTFDHNDIGAALSNFPLLVYLSNSSGRYSDDVNFIFSELQNDSNRKKIAVTTDDGLTQCYVEIERWNDGNKQAWLWVNAPSVSATVDTVLNLYYDKNQTDNTVYVGDSNSTVAQKVWGNYLTVHHMEEDPTGSITDSTTNQLNMTSSGGMTSSNLVNGRIGKGVNFDGVDDHYDSSPNNITIQMFAFEAWIWIGANYNNWRTITNVGPTSNYRDFCVVDRRLALDDATPNYFGSAMSTGTWHYVVSTYDGSTCRGYIDGVAQSNTYSKSWGSINSNFTFSEWGGQYDYFNGTLDEIRISNTTLSASWIIANYETERDHLLDFGSEELDFGGAGSTTYDYVLRIVNQGTNNLTTSLRVYNSSNIGRISNTTISFHDGTSSDQIIVSNGIITQSQGAPYNLAGNATIYTRMSNLQANTTDTSYLYVYLKALVPNTSTYSLYVITFEIT